MDEGRGEPTPPGRLWPICGTSSLVLTLLGVLFLLFGILYLAFPDPVVSLVSGSGRSLGLDSLPPSGSPSAFGGWLVFTFAYMMGAAGAAFLAAFERRDPIPYTRLLILLKFTSSLTALALFLIEARYAFYLVTALVDGLLGTLIGVVAVHLRHHMERLKNPLVPTGRTR